MRHERIPREVRIGDLAAAIALFGPSFAGLAHEELRIAYLDTALRVIRVTALSGTRSSIIMPLGAVIREAVAVDAHALLLAHNHPCGDATPSRADKAVTRRIADIVRPLDIRLLDHLIFSGDHCASFRVLGLL